MSNAVIAWLVIFAVSALVFFGVAVVVSVRGFTDLLNLLRHSRMSAEEAAASEDGENI